MRLDRGSSPFSGSSPMFSRPTRGFVHAHEVLGVDGAQVRELDEVLRPAVHVRARVDQQDAAVRGSGGACRSAGGPRPASGRRRTSEAAITAPVEPALMNASDLALLLEIQPDDDRGVRLPPDRLCRRLAHLDSLGGVDDLDPLARSVGKALAAPPRSAHGRPPGPAESRRPESSSAPTAPSTSVAGARSEPIASSAIRMADCRA